MRKIIAAAAAWAGIIALGWRLADARIKICPTDVYQHTTECAVRATAARDSVLLLGLIAVFVACLVAALVGHRRGYWPKIQLRNGERANEARPATNSLRTTSSAVGRIVWGANRRPVVRIFATMIFGMVLAAGLLWSAGALELGVAPVGGRDGQPQADPFADLIPRVRQPASGTPTVEADTSQAEPADPNAFGDENANIEDE